jgi:hypothetical protein
MELACDPSITQNFEVVTRFMQNSWTCGINLYCTLTCLCRVCDLFTHNEFSLSFSSVCYIILLQTKESQNLHIVHTDARQVITMGDETTVFATSRIYIINLL